MWVAEFFHVMFGIFWIGLLWFFNLVQVPNMPKMTEAGAAKPYTQIILPKANQRDFEELPDYIKKGISVHFAGHYDEVFELVF